MDRFLRPLCNAITSRSYTTFSILAVGSFPQTSTKAASRSGFSTFQYPRCWIVSSDPLETRPAECFQVIFQYPRCWIVSSDLRSAWLRFAHRKSFSILAVGSFPQTPGAHGNQARDRSLSVSSLLDRFLRPPPRARRDRSQSTLSVSSLLDRFLRPKLGAGTSAGSTAFQYPRCWIVSSDPKPPQRCRRISPSFQYPRCWIVSSDRHRTVFR